MAATPSDVPSAAPSLARTVVAVALGGVIGAEARYGLSLALPHRPGTWPWSTLLTNLIGCLLIGALLVVLLERTTPHPLARPFLGVGVLGGFTTFSTFALDADALIHEHRVALAAAYVLVSLIGGVLAVAVGGAAARSTVRAAGPRP